MKWIIVRDGVRIGTFSTQEDAIEALKLTSGVIKQAKLKDEEMGCEIV